MKDEVKASLERSRRGLLPDQLIPPAEGAQRQPENGGPQ
jgi:hypothetical protein